MLFVYPAVVYNKTEEEPFVIVVPDVNIVAEGDSLEDALVDAKSQLKIYLQCVNKFSANLPKPTSYDEFRLRYPDNAMMFVDASVLENEEDEITIIF